ncbi:LLM class flavin-dependent oxidoreductase [Kineococcus rhizosphaerae]|uniref:Pyrimidine oxygenase n=1 Tax=Kineococcus rhizosphaerae TaxID=559628 RepID=A0A2T0QXN1_9ACTN|nr:LLM class flavin-dependent oxidoreductase [Kineococcus rhizosphaerae]PRY10798.1 pyrimidine oxygenase [Kineococcus rhizosphaerae]
MRTGLFLPTTNNGYLYSAAAPQYAPSYALNRRATLAAEAVGMDFVLSMVKHRGYGGPMGFWDQSLESLAMMGPLVEATSTIGLWASVGAPSLHPAMAAKAAAVLDEASGGRFGLNVVGGWNRAEYAQMGLWPSADYHARRYAYVEEYLDVVRGLWEHGRLTHHGEFFDLDDCLLDPRPVHGVTVVVPGQSPRSLASAGRQADVNFVLGDLPTLARARRGLLDVARPLGRRVESCALFGVITAPTDAEAADTARAYLEAADAATLAGLQAAAGTDASGTAANGNLKDQARGVPEIRFDHPVQAPVVVGPGLYQPNLVGSYDRVAATLDALETECDVTGCVLSVPDYTTDVEILGAEVLPRARTVRRAGRGAVAQHV